MSRPKWSRTVPHFRVESQGAPRAGHQHQDYHQQSLAHCYGCMSGVLQRRLSGGKLVGIFASTGNTCWQLLEQDLTCNIIAKFIWQVSPFSEWVGVTFQFSGAKLLLPRLQYMLVFCLFCVYCKEFARPWICCPKRLTWLARNYGGGFGYSTLTAPITTFTSSYW